MRLDYCTLPVLIPICLLTFLPAHATPALTSAEIEQKQSQQQALDREAQELNQETQRLVRVRGSLETQMNDLRQRLEDHNLRTPDPTNYEAVLQYNQRAARLNQQRQALETEVCAFDQARLRLRDRALAFQQRTIDFQNRWK